MGGRVERLEVKNEESWVCAGEAGSGGEWRRAGVEATEVVADDGGGDGGVEGFGGAVSRDGDEAGDAGFHGGGEAAAFAADDDDGVGMRGERVDVVADEVAAEDGRAGVSEGGGEIGGVDADAGEGAHAGVDDFLVEEVGGVGGEEDAIEAEPVGEAEERADVAGILQAVEGEGEAVVEGAGRERFAVEAADGEERGRCREMADTGHFGGGDFDDARRRGGAGGGRRGGGGGVDFEEGKAGGEEFGDDFLALDDEEAERLAMFFVAEGAEALDFGFREHVADETVRGRARRGELGVEGGGAGRMVRRNMEKRVTWGILATGGIARAFAGGVAHSRTGRVVAVGSRTQASAERFAREFGIARAHGSYEALLADPQVEAVYIATPHPQHAEWIVKAARAGKHVLCEKPLTLTRAEAEGAVEACRAAGVLLMEAFMYRCHPQTAKIVELVRSGAIGRVGLVQATFSFSTAFDPKNRFFEQGSVGGGGNLGMWGVIRCRWCGWWRGRMRARRFSIR